MADSFVFYESFYEAIEEIEDEAVQLAIYKAISRYALCGEEPQLKGTPSAIFKLVRPQLDANRKRRENGKNGGRPNQEETKPKPNNNQDITNGEPNNNQDITNGEPNVNVNGNANVNGNEEGDKRAKRFAPPTPDVISQYAKEKGISIDADRFCDFYESKGWMVGKTKMKDWKAAARGWASRDKTMHKDTRKSFTQHEYTDKDRARQKAAAIAEIEAMDLGEFDSG